MNKTGLILLIFIAAISCDKENDPIIEKNKTGLLSRVLISGEPYQEYTYTKSGWIYEEKSWSMYTKYSYNSDNLLVKSESWVDPSIVSSSTQVIAEAQKRKEWANTKNVPKSVTNIYEYPKTGQIIERYVDRANGTQDYGKYELNAKGLVSKHLFYNEGKPSGYVDYSYDESGNLIQEKKYFISADGNSKLKTQTEYEFDNKKNPYFSFNKLIYPGRNANPNNITKTTYTLYGETPSVIEWLDIATHTYEYNDLGFPVKVDSETSYEYY